MLRINAVDENLIEFEEPDFESMPIKWVRCVDRCLRDVRHQRDTVASFDPLMEPEFPSILQAAYVCKRFGHENEMIIERGKPQARISGWFLTCNNEADRHDIKELSIVSLYELALRVRGIVQFLAIPAGCAGRISRTEVEIYRGEELLRVRPGSYLSELQKRAALQAS